MQKRLLSSKERRIVNLLGTIQVGAYEEEEVKQ